jgi:CRP-like cAMP-binding protein
MADQGSSTSESPGRTGSPMKHLSLAQRLSGFAERRLNLAESPGKRSRLLRGMTVIKPKSTFSRAKPNFLSSNGPFKKSWDSIKTLLLVFTFVYYPLKMMVFREANITATVIAKLLEYMVDFFFLIDIILNFLIRNNHSTADANNGRQIAMNYLKGQFFLDTVAILPYELIYDTWGTELSYKSQTLSQVLRVAQLCKLFRLRHLFRIISRMKAYSEQNYLLEWIIDLLDDSVMGQVLPNLLLFSMSMHLFGCLWLYIGQTSSRPNSWLMLNHQYDAVLVDRYTYSFYSVTQTFTTVGYGDVICELNLERAMRIVTMISGVLIYNMFSGQIVNYQSQEQNKSDLLLKKRKTFLEVAERYQVPERIFKLVLESIDDQPLRKPEERKPDLDLLDKESRDDLEYQVFLKQFSGIPIFSSSMGHRNFVLELGRSIKTLEIDAERIIYEKGEPPGACYIIVSGQIHVMSSLAENLPICCIKKGYFGELELMKNEPRRFTIQSKTDVVLLCLPWDKFKSIFMRIDKSQEQVIQQDQEDFQRRILAFSLKRWRRIESMNEKMSSLLRRDTISFNSQYFFAA